MTRVLGVSAFYHDSAACLVEDGAILAASQEERFSRRVGDSSLPIAATLDCLTRTGTPAESLDAIVFYEKPLMKLERILQNHLEVAPRGLWQWRMMSRRLWSEKLRVEHTIRSLAPGFRGEVMFAEHHEAHAASAFYPSPFEESAILSIDGVGEWATASWGWGRGKDIVLEQEMKWPDSLGLFYSAVTAALGFQVNRDEYKVMGLAAFGTPCLVGWIEAHVLQRHRDGSCSLLPQLLAYRWGSSMVASQFQRELGFALRTSDGELTQAARDLAASAQLILEESVLAMARHVAERTKAESLCLAGGVAYNCLANGRLRREGPFRSLWIQPAAGDAGAAVGAALLAWYREYCPGVRQPESPDGMCGALLGPTISSADALAAAGAHGLQVVAAGTGAAIEAVVDALVNGSVVAVASGPMEFGPRALGNRSILADPRVPGIRDRLNRAIKHRDSFRPFAPAVLEEHVNSVFYREVPSPYMLETVATRDGKSDSGTDWRAIISGAIHVDGSARIQTVAATHHSPLRRILESFFARTGCPVLINTSFNDADVPIACSADDACVAMARTSVELLLLSDIAVTGTGNPVRAEPNRDVTAPVWRRASRRLAAFGRVVSERLFDAIVVLVFFVAVVPAGVAYLIFSRADRGSAVDVSSWARRWQQSSDLRRLF